MANGKTRTLCEAAWLSPRRRQAPTAAPTYGRRVTDMTCDPHGRGVASDATASEATYGHISTWETGGTTMESHVRRRLVLRPGHRRVGHLRRHDDGGHVLRRLGLRPGPQCVGHLRRHYDAVRRTCSSIASSFDQDIGGWDTSGVTMHGVYVPTAPRPSTRTSAGAWTTTWSLNAFHNTPCEVDVVRRHARQLPNTPPHRRRRAQDAGAARRRGVRRRLCRGGRDGRRSRLRRFTKSSTRRRSPATTRGTRRRENTSRARGACPGSPPRSRSSPGISRPSCSMMMMR